MQNQNSQPIVSVATRFLRESSDRLLRLPLQSDTRKQSGWQTIYSPQELIVSIRQKSLLKKKYRRIRVHENEQFAGIGPGGCGKVMAR